MPPTLEESIKQKRFKSPYQKGMINLIYTSGLIQSRQNQIFKEFGITLSQYNVLRILRGQYPCPATVTLLIDRMLDKTSNASRIVERLRKKELVIRCRKEEDRRQVNVSITEKGLQLLEEIDALENELFCGMDTLSQEEIDVLNQTLDKIREAIPGHSCKSSDHLQTSNNIV